MFIKKIIFSIVFVALPGMAWASRPQPWQFFYQDPASLVMSKISELHVLLMYMMTFIVCVVFFIMIIAIIKFRHGNDEKKRNVNPIISKIVKFCCYNPIFMIIPCAIVLISATLSTVMLLEFDKNVDTEMTVKVVGHQWYWSYEYPEYSLEFDGFMVDADDLKANDPRLLTTDTEVVIPVNTKVKLIFTSDDVIHSWSVPAIGIKMDAVPGRLNESWVKVSKPGIYYGQCYELCGADHAFMPIKLRVVSKQEFNAWVDYYSDIYASN